MSSFYLLYAKPSADEVALKQSPLNFDFSKFENAKPSADEVALKHAPAELLFSCLVYAKPSADEVALKRMMLEQAAANR